MITQSQTAKLTLPRSFPYTLTSYQAGLQAQPEFSTSGLQVQPGRYSTRAASTARTRFLLDFSCVQQSAETSGSGEAFALNQT
jgi:hypothetical protein